MHAHTNSAQQLQLVSLQLYVEREGVGVHQSRLLVEKCDVGKLRAWCPPVPVVTGKQRPVQRTGDSLPQLGLANVFEPDALLDGWQRGSAEQACLCSCPQRLVHITHGFLQKGLKLDSWSVHGGRTLWQMTTTALVAGNTLHEWLVTASATRCLQTSEMGSGLVEVSTMRAQDCKPTGADAVASTRISCKSWCVHRRWASPRWLWGISDHRRMATMVIDAGVVSTTKAVTATCCLHAIVTIDGGGRRWSL